LEPSRKKKDSSTFSARGLRNFARVFEGDGILGGIGSIRAEEIDFLPVQILRFSER